MKINVVVFLFVFIFSLFQSCQTIQVNDRGVNIPRPKAKFFLNNPGHYKNTKTFVHTYKEFYLLWGLYRLGHFPSVRNPLASPRENYLEDVHAIEKAGVYVNVEVSSSKTFTDLLISIPGAFLIVTGFISSRTVVVKGEAVKNKSLRK